MLLKFAVLASFLVSAFSFIAPSARVVCNLRMSSDDASFLPGATLPFGFFDPLGLSKGKSEGVLIRYRESELKHGRLVCFSPSSDQNLRF